MLSKITLAVALAAAALSPVSPIKAQGKLTGAVPLASYTADEVQTLLTGLGIPSLFLTPIYDVELYRITYLTPYRHPDSLVQASGLVIVPLGTEEAIPCGLPLAAYGHGTEASANYVPSKNINDAQALVNVAFASLGYVCAATDYLGLGDYDERVLVHPYQHAFSQANETINMIRATRHFMDSLSHPLNGQVYLHGYSQGGFTTAAALREIESTYPEEFNVVASAPMSGAYDMCGAQADLISLDVPYPTPGYLPYIILAYQDQYGGVLFNDYSDIFVSPYDTLLPPLFYGKETGIGTINELCTPVPKDMMQDSVVSNFETDPNHRFRRLLAENDMLEWAPQSPVRILYCSGDDQVSSLNSERAFNRWTELGAPAVEKNDFGAYNHNDCALFCFLDARDFFDSFEKCPLSGDPAQDMAQEAALAGVLLSPNPVSSTLRLSAGLNLSGEGLRVFDATGRLWFQTVFSGTTTELNLSALPAGWYAVQIGDQVLRFLKQ